MEFFDPPQLERDIVHITDVSKAVGAEYWVSSEDDYDMEWSGAFRKAHAQMKKLEEVWPVGFASQNNRLPVPAGLHRGSRMRVGGEIPWIRKFKSNHRSALAQRGGEAVTNGCGSLVPVSPGGYTAKAIAPLRQDRRKSELPHLKQTSGFNDCIRY